MRDIIVDTLSPNAIQPYVIKVGAGLRHHATEEIAAVTRQATADTRIFFLSDNNVWQRGRARALHAVLTRAFKSVNVLTLHPGEGSKTWETARYVFSQIEQANLSRSDIIVTCGGGTISDLGGFVASLYKRGCRVIHFPTTLLAMVDAAIGGKTGINGVAKNNIGTFYNPSAVICDTEFLSTLPVRELNSGYAEAIKHGVIWREDLFDMIEQNDTPDNMPPLQLVAIIELAAFCKARAVSLDPFETKDLRLLLNFGHTFGHAIEACLDFSVPHGEAVAIGMVMASEIAALEMRCTPITHQRIIAVLKRCSLPTRIMSLDPDERLTPERMFDHMMQDKKAEGDVLPLILPVSIGKGIVERGISKDFVLAYLKEAFDTLPD